MKPPAYLLHKSSTQAYVRVGSRMIYLGRYGSPESHERYQQVLLEWRATGGVLVRPELHRITVAEVAAAYLQRAETYGYAPTSVMRIRRAMLGLMQYADLPADEFGPLKLMAIRQSWIEEDLSRSYINAITQYARAAFTHAVSLELIPPGVAQSLNALENLKQGRSAAREGTGRSEVQRHHVDAVLPLMSPTLATLTEFIWYTGCRPGEACILRPIDVDRSGNVWEFRPYQHKNQHKGHARVVFIGPEAQRCLLPLLNRPPEAYCFCPEESQLWYRIMRRPGVFEPLVPVKGEKHVQEHAYLLQVKRLCKRAQIPRWTPHQLRHAAASRFKAAHGLLTSKSLLGHASLKATEIYGQDDKLAAVRAAMATG